MPWGSSSHSTPSLRTRRNSSTAQPTNITADSAPQIAAITFALHCLSSRCTCLFKHISGCAIGWAQPCTQKDIVGHQEGLDLISTSWHLTSPSQQHVSPCVSCLFCAVEGAVKLCLSSWQHGAGRKPAANRQLWNHTTQVGKHKNDMTTAGRP